jgi:hypothetical protein
MTEDKQTTTRHSVSFNSYVEGIVAKAHDMWPELPSYSAVIARIIADWDNQRSEGNGGRRQQLAKIPEILEIVKEIRDERKSDGD